MFKKNQPGFPCTATVPQLLNTVEPGTKCIELKVFGLANGTCNCCSGLNSPDTKYYFGIYAASRYHISDFGDVCNGMSMTCIAPYSIGAGVCACLGTFHFPQLIPTARFTCEDSWFYFPVFYDNEPMTFGWPWDGAGHGVTGADSDAAREAFRQLANGDTATLPVYAPLLGTLCNRSAAYATIKVVDCPSPGPGTLDQYCQTATNACHHRWEVDHNDGFPRHSTLRLDDFGDCVETTIGTIPVVEHWVMSNLNREYEVEWQPSKDTTENGPIYNPPCGVAYDTLPGTIFYLPLGTYGDYTDPGILVRWDDWGVPIYEHTSELYATGIVVSANCWDGGPDSSNVNKMVVKFIAIKYQAYDIWNKGTPEQYWQIQGSPYCDVYVAGIFDGVKWVDDDSVESGAQLQQSGFQCYCFSGMLSTIDYTLCDTTQQFLALLDIHPVYD